MSGSTHAVPRVQSLAADADAAKGAGAGAGAGSGESYFVAAEKLISGNPTQTAWVQHASADGRFSAGLWHSEVGKWHIRYTEDEYCRILEGCSIIGSADGHAITVRPGDEFIIPRGFVGTWEVVEPTLKRFAMHEPGG